MKSLRYGIPKGNLWLYTCDSPGFKSYGISKSKQIASKQAKTNSFTGIASKPEWIYNVGEYYLKGSNIENNAKLPMLVVGSNSYIRNNIPYFLIQQYDIHLLFAPSTNEAHYRVGVIAMNRQAPSPPVFTYCNDIDVSKALQTALYSLLIKTKPNTEKVLKYVNKFERIKNLWWTHWIYRCPKISLKDVMALEPYKTKEAS